MIGRFGLLGIVAVIVSGVAWHVWFDTTLFMSEVDDRAILRIKNDYANYMDREYAEKSKALRTWVDANTSGRVRASYLQWIKASDSLNRDLRRDAVLDDLATERARTMPSPNRMVGGKNEP